MKVNILILLIWLCLSFTVQAAEQVVYLHSDALGSPVAASDESGNLLWRESYRPYGERIQNTDSGANEQWFTGKVFDEDTKLSYFGARYYDPVVGRFMGIDPVGFQEDNIHSFNRYAYANDNPYRFVDPDGEQPFDIRTKRLNPYSLDAGYGPGLGAGGKIATSRTYENRSFKQIIDDRAKVATKSADAGLNLFRSGKSTTMTSQGWKMGDRMLNLPNKGSPKANWKQNSGFLRQEMGKGKPIFDSYRNPRTGAQIPSGQTPTSSGRFLNAERQLLETRGWKYNPQNGAYHPPVN